jgi:hypothetical protein
VLKAIETQYKGYRFRSRLEARWAVFFDALGLRWEYEPEGFELGDGVRYLPDFRLPDLGLWVEVKPCRADELARDKAGGLLLGTGAPVFITCGMPDALGEAHWSYTQIGGEWNWHSGVARIHWDLAPWGCHIGLYNRRPCFDIEAHDHGARVHVDGTDATGVTGDRIHLVDDEARALDAARSARFEFGENGGLADFEALRR